MSGPLWLPPYVIEHGTNPLKPARCDPEHRRIEYDIAVLVKIMATASVMLAKPISGVFETPATDVGSALSHTATIHWYREVTGRPECYCGTCAANRERARNVGTLALASFVDYIRKNPQSTHDALHRLASIYIKTSVVVDSQMMQGYVPNL